MTAKKKRATPVTKKAIERAAAPLLPKPPAGRPGLLTEQLVFRVSKATRARIEAYRRAHQLDNIADALRMVLREQQL